MDQNIVIIDGRGTNPAKLQTHVDPVRFDRGMSMAISSIAYGEISNIHNENNAIYFSMSSDEEIMGVVYKCEIPIGTYANTVLIGDEIIQSVRMKIDDMDPSKSKGAIKIHNFDNSRKFKITLHGIIIHVVNREDSPWNILGVFTDMTAMSKESMMENRELMGLVEPAIIYANIVESSYINGKKARNLAVIPLELRRGYTFHEFTNPDYVPIEVHQFSNIQLEIRDLNGKFVKFNPRWNTVITIRLKAINRSR